MPEPMTMALLAGGAGLTKGVSGYKAGQSSAKSAMATAAYNKQIADINAKMEADRGRITSDIIERNAEVIADKASYDSFLLERQADQTEDQTAFDLQIAERQYDIFTAEKRAKWGNSGVTMQGSPATVAFADAHAAAVNLANIELRGKQAAASIDQTAAMTRYKGKADYNATMQQAYLQQYASDIQRANIINEGNMNMYAGMSQAYQARQQANAALVGGFTDAITAGVGAYGSAGGFAGGAGSGATPTGASLAPMGSFDTTQGFGFQGF
jgi:hypothetical protein|tara:strand:- start:4 stop:810 length:807 start_codon:yes stop_codon:yes gene_type:complete